MTHQQLSRLMQLSIVTAVTTEESPVTTDQSPVTGEGQTSYLDVGIIPWWDFVNWQTTPPGIKQAEFDAYFNSLFTQLQNAGVNEINLSFSQISDIPMLGDTITNATDLFGIYLHQYPEQVRQCISKGSLEYGMSFNLSFAGLNALPNDYNIPTGLGEEYANQLLAKLTDLGINGVDIDIELNTFDDLSCKDELKIFFRTLRESLGTRPDDPSITCKYL